MKSSMMLLRTKNLLSLLIILMLGISCSKSPGKTATKLKLFSGNAFTTILSTKANNGLIFYGHSSTGQTFAKKIDNDSVDLVFPNGTWNFYAVAWELGTAPAAGTVPDFTGKTYCGKTTSVFNGTDASVSINLTNLGCSDADFTAFPKTMTSGEVQLPKASFFTCKDLSAITSLNYTACDQNLGANFNKGYATSYRIIAFDADLAAGVAPVKIAQSACVRADFSTLTGMLDSSDSSLLNSIHIPTTLGNGLNIFAEVFYSGGASKIGGGTASTGCEANAASDLIPLTNSPRAKLFVDNPTSPGMNATYNLFVQSSAADVCQGPRLAATNFAAGFGTAGSPFAICNKDQFALIQANFLSFKESSFDLLTDIDYANTTNGAPTIIAPIGEALVDAGGNLVNNYYYGKISTPVTSVVFDGKNHKISNFEIDCKTNVANSVDNNQIGFFRKIKDATIKNLTFNNAVIFCNHGSDVGMVAGSVESTGLTAVDNIRIHGHAEGMDNIGGLFGQLAGSNATITNVHIVGDMNGSHNAGGLVGFINMTNGGAVISKSSFNGGISSNSGGGMADISRIGGIAGYAFTSTGNNTFDQVIVKAKRLEGSTTLGGFAGETNYLTITDSYAESVIRAYGSTDGTSTFTDVGGAIGKANSGVLTRVLVYDTYKASSSRGPTDHHFGGLVGAGTCPSFTNSFYTGEDDAGGPFAGSCGTSTTIASSKMQITYAPNGFLSTRGVDWDVVASPSLYTPTCSPSEKGTYHIAITAGTSASSFSGNNSFSIGDIILCNGSAFGYVPLPSIPTALAVYPWNMPDDSHDVPRLNFEADIENAVPYLKRECHNHYATQNGAGTSANPFWVCDSTQFSAMAGNGSTYYILKKNISYEGAVGAFTPLAAGTYLLDGNRFALHGFTMTLPGSTASNYDYGIFSALSVGSVIKNLDIIASSINSSNATSGAAISINAGVLAGKNSGTISNVMIEMSKATLSYAAAYPDTINFGGAIGLNASGALIEKSELNVDTKILNGGYSIASAFAAGTVAGKNDGTISGVRGHGSLDRVMTCTTPAMMLSFGSKEQLGSFVGINTSTIKEIESEGEIMAENDPAGPYQNCPFAYASNISSFISNNSGSVSDFKVRSYKYFSNTNSAPLFELFGTTAGPVTRGFVTLDSMNVNVFLKNQTFTNHGGWDPSTNSTAVGDTPFTCTLATTGGYVNVTTASSASNILSTAFVIGDQVICNGSQFVVMSLSTLSRVIANDQPTTDVLFVVEDKYGGTCSNPAFYTQATCTPTYTWTVSPTLPAGRFYDNKLNFYLGTGLKVVELNTPSVLFDHNTWAVGANFFVPGTNTWILELTDPTNLSSFGTKLPELVKTGGSLDQIGPIFN